MCLAVLLKINNSTINLLASLSLRDFVNIPDIVLDLYFLNFVLQTLIGLDALYSDIWLRTWTWISFFMKFTKPSCQILCVWGTRKGSKSTGYIKFPNENDLIVTRICEIIMLRSIHWINVTLHKLHWKPAMLQNIHRNFATLQKHT